MNKAERAIAYRVALNGRGSDLENAIARICATLPANLENRAEAVWEGALLAEVKPWQLHALTGKEDWPSIAALADLEGEDSWSKVVRYNRDRFAEWSLEGM